MILTMTIFLMGGTSGTGSMVELLMHASVGVPLFSL